MNNKTQVERIRSLMNEYLDVVHSPGNEENRKLWGNPYGWNRDMWRAGRAAGASFAPRTIAPDNSFWGKLFGISLRDYYSNPYDYMETQLKIRLYQHHHFKDNTYFTDELYLWFGVVTEYSFFGSEIEFFPHKEAWIKKPVIESPGDIGRLKPVDFYKSRLMPSIHQFFEVMSELAEGKLKVMFPDFIRGPFSIAAHLVGIQKILFAVMDSPGTVHRLLQFVTEQHVDAVQR